MAYKLKNTCKKCSKEYLVSEVHKNYGSDRDECWPCLKQWMLDAANDPYRMGAAIMRCELPQHISDQGAALFKQAFETAFAMLYPNRSVLAEVMKKLEESLEGPHPPLPELSAEFVASIMEPE